MAYAIEIKTKETLKMWESDDKDEWNIREVPDTLDRKDNPSTYTKDSNTYYCPEHGAYPAWAGKCPRCA